MNKGQLIVVSGFAGTGKGTLMKLLIEKYDNYVLSVSATTRNPRNGEEEGKHYFFKTRDEFEKMIADDALLEYAQYVDNYYGTPKEFVDQNIENGKNVILEIEIQGALKIKEKFPEAVLIFVLPPSAVELKKRLIGRGTETEEVINKRLRRAVEESDGIHKYDFILVNDDLNSCVDKMNQAIISATLTPDRNKGFISNLKNELEVLLKGE